MGELLLIHATETKLNESHSMKIKIWANHKVEETETGQSLMKGTWKKELFHSISPGTISVCYIVCVAHSIYLCHFISTTTTTLRQTLWFSVGLIFLVCLPHDSSLCFFSALCMSLSLGYDRTVYICTLLPFRIGFVFHQFIRMIWAW